MTKPIQKSLNKKYAKKQLVTVFLLACFIVVSLLTEAFILTHADHLHEHNTVCVTCEKLHNAESLLKQLNTMIIGISFLFAGLFAIFSIIKAAYSKIIILSPITLKIRMNN